MWLFWKIQIYNMLELFYTLVSRMFSDIVSLSPLKNCNANFSCFCYFLLWYKSCICYLRRWCWRSRPPSSCHVSSVGFHWRHRSWRCSSPNTLSCWEESWRWEPALCFWFSCTRAGHTCCDLGGSGCKSWSCWDWRGRKDEPVEPHGDKGKLNEGRINYWNKNCSWCELI